jgi:hypothetical protein
MREKKQRIWKRNNWPERDGAGSNYCKAIKDIHKRLLSCRTVVTMPKLEKLVFLFFFGDFSLLHEWFSFAPPSTLC